MTYALFTIGFTKTPAREFFGKLRSAGVRRVLDTRVNRDGQLSGFAKAADLRYFLRALVNCDYAVASELAPAPELRQQYRDKQLSWDEYARLYQRLLEDRKAELSLGLRDLDRACLLCSERSPDRCHRRLAAEYLKRTVPGASALEIVHL